MKDSHHSHVGLGKYHAAGHSLKGEEDVQHYLTDNWSFRAANDGSRQTAPFNVLFVKTPGIRLFQTPEWQAFASTWKEMVDTVRSFGVPHTSLETKCPHYRCAGWAHVTRCDDDVPSAMPRPSPAEPPNLP